MSAIAVQTVVGEIGGKATTTLDGYDFNSFATINGFEFGADHNGLHLLNTGDQDNEEDYTRTLTFATTDFGDNNPKRIRFIYVGVEATSPFTLSVKADEQSWRNYTVTPLKTGLQRVRVPVGRDGQGRYWAIKVTATTAFRIDSVDAMIYERSTGIKGY